MFMNLAVLFGVVLGGPVCWSWKCEYNCCNDSGRRRSEEEIHEICHGASEQIQGKFRQTMAILAGDGSNQDSLVEMAEEIREWCSTLTETDTVANTQRQCQAYAGLLMELTQDDEHPASVMLVGAYGDNVEQESACGLIVRTLNQALFEGHFDGLVVTKISNDGIDESGAATTVEVDTVVAATQARVDEVAGTEISLFSTTLGTAAVTIGSAVVSAVFLLIELCHDYDATSMLPPL